MCFRKIFLKLISFLKLVLILFIVIQASSFDALSSYIEGKTYYVLGTSVNLREGPSINYGSIGHLTINSPVEIVGEENNWYKVSDLEDRLYGYIHKDFIGPNKQTCEQMLKNFNNTPKTKIPDQVKWLENALAIDPTSIEALENLIKIYYKSNKDKASYYKKELDFIQNPDSYIDKNEPTVIFIYSNNSIQPLALLKNNTLTNIVNSEETNFSKYLANYEIFIENYLRPGRSYFLINEYKIIDKAIVSQYVKAGSYVCHGPIPIKVKLEKNNEFKSSELIIASNHKLNPVKSSNPRSLNDAQKHIIKDTSKPIIKNYLSEYNELDIYNDISIEIDGFIKDLDADGKNELVGAVNFYNQSKHYSAYVILVFKLNMNNTYDPIYKLVQGGSQKGIVHYLKIYGAVDLNGDSKEDLIIEKSVWENEVIEILLNEGTSFKKSNIAVWLNYMGC